MATQPGGPGTYASWSNSSHSPEATASSGRHLVATGHMTVCPATQWGPWKPRLAEGLLDFETNTSSQRIHLGPQFEKQLLSLPTWSLWDRHRVVPAHVPEGAWRSHRRGWNVVHGGSRAPDTARLPGPGRPRVFMATTAVCPPEQFPRRRVLRSDTGTRVLSQAPRGADRPARTWFFGHGSHVITVMQGLGILTQRIATCSPGGDARSLSGGDLVTSWGECLCRPLGSDFRRKAARRGPGPEPKV